MYLFQITIIHTINSDTSDSETRSIKAPTQCMVEDLTSYGPGE